MGDLPRIELFARQKAKGWDVWGNEAPKKVTKFYSKKNVRNPTLFK